MCGIVGYVGDVPARDFLLFGLERLAYRGYDSAGIAELGGQNVHLCKREGKLKNLRSALKATETNPQHTTGIGHTRWATHGSPSDINAHPVQSQNLGVVVVHNGIIENFAELKRELVDSGVRFLTDTDTEVIANLIERKLLQGVSRKEAVLHTLRLLRGSFAILVGFTKDPTTLYAARKESPLVFGLGMGEVYIASDSFAFGDLVHTAMDLENGQAATITKSGVEVYTFDGVPINNETYPLRQKSDDFTLGTYKTYMQKEINQTPIALRDTLSSIFEDFDRLPVDILKNTTKILLLACGSAAYACASAAYALESWLGIPVRVELAHEFSAKSSNLGACQAANDDSRVLAIGVSQSGETIDTIMAVKRAKMLGATTIALCNTDTSSISKVVDFTVLTRAGHEVSVASTKTFVSQIAALYAFGLFLANVIGAKNPLTADFSTLKKELFSLADACQETLTKTQPVSEIAQHLAHSKCIFFIGKGACSILAKEGALKLKEVAYVYAEGFAAGELKHGPIALIEPGTPVFAILPSRKSALYNKLISNIQEVCARGAKVVALLQQEDPVVSNLCSYVLYYGRCLDEFVPVVASSILQLFAHDVALELKRDIDQPRNLAKSVTVE